MAFQHKNWSRLAQQGNGSISGIDMLVLFFARIKNSNHVQGCRPLVDLQAFREHVYSLLLCWAMLDADIRLFERIIKPLDIYFVGFT